jgi:hypothetical protein
MTEEKKGKKRKKKKERKKKEEAKKGRSFFEIFVKGGPVKRKKITHLNVCGLS